MSLIGFYSCNLLASDLLFDCLNFSTSLSRWPVIFTLPNRQFILQELLKYY
jgi:hypothetical protein